MAAAPSADGIAAQVLQAVVQYYAARSIEGIASLYGDDSVLSFDGTIVSGRAAIATALASRTFSCVLQLAAGPVSMRTSSIDAQSGGGYLFVCVTGECTAPAGRFSEVYVLAASAAGPLYIRTHVFRSGPGATAQNTSLEPSGTAVRFVTQYYQMYMSMRAGMAPLYAAPSQLKFESAPLVVGPEAILAQLQRMPEGTPGVDTIDVVPSIPGLTIVYVTGRFLITGETNPMNFVHSFALGSGATLYVAHEMFKFNYGA